MPELVNTTPHSITLKLTDGSLKVVPPSTDAALVALFRGTTTVKQTEPLALADGFVATSGKPIYDLDAEAFFRLVQPAVPTVYLISTISAEMIAKMPSLRHPNARFFVPYSGPDSRRCLRENGQIVWVAELMEYE